LLLKLMVTLAPAGTVMVLLSNDMPWATRSIVTLLLVVVAGAVVVDAGAVVVDAGAGVVGRDVVVAGFEVQDAVTNKAIINPRTARYL